MRARPQTLRPSICPKRKTGVADGFPPPWIFGARGSSLPGSTRRKQARANTWIYPMRSARGRAQPSSHAVRRYVLGDADTAEVGFGMLPARWGGWVEDRDGDTDTERGGWAAPKTAQLYGVYSNCSTDTPYRVWPSRTVHPLPKITYRTPTSCNDQHQTTIKSTLQIRHRHQQPQLH